MSPPFYLISAACIGLTIVGCSKSTETEEPFTASFHPREFTMAEQMQRKELLHRIVGKTYLNQQDLESELKGKAVGECIDLLELADRFSVYGHYLAYDYTIRVDDLTDPKRYEEGDGFLTIVVVDGVVTGVDYAELCR